MMGQCSDYDKIFYSHIKNNNNFEPKEKNLEFILSRTKHVNND